MRELEGCDSGVITMGQLEQAYKNTVQYEGLPEDEAQQIFDRIVTEVNLNEQGSFNRLQVYEAFMS